MTQLPRLAGDFRPTGLRGQKVMVLGLGSFGGGLGAALHLAREGAELTIADLHPASGLADSLAALGSVPFRPLFGRHPTETEVAAQDWIVASPAVPWSAAPLAAAAAHGIPVESEITLLVRLLPCRWLGITGTNGKSTTTMLAGHALAAGGKRVWSGGNLGGSLLGEVGAMGREDLAVLEISSFQLEHLGELGLGPPVALVTNVTPDHLDRHGTFAQYVAAKRQILRRAEVAVLSRTDGICREFAQGFAGRVVDYGDAAAFGPDEPGARLRDERFAVWREADGRETAVDLARFPLLGTHNRCNLLAAAAAATCFGVDFEAAVRSTFLAEPLARRLNIVGRVGGVVYVDDSVSTSPPAVAAALASFPGPVRLLAGGYDKGIDPAPLLDAILGGGARVYLYGMVGPKLAEQLARAVARAKAAPAMATWAVFPDLRAAFAAAARDASAGETVLFSPGFASYDQFRNFTERGALFCDLVAALPPAAPPVV